MNHLPECWLSEGKFDALCLCERLRACKERVLDAAREAIAAIPSGRYAIQDALAAFDALKEQP